MVMYETKEVGGFEKVPGKYTYGRRKDKGLNILEFCQTLD